MLLPSVNAWNNFVGENLLDDGWMNFPFESEWFGRKNPLRGKSVSEMMKTDIQEREDGYELSVDLPGFAKDEISAKLENGYLTIAASRAQNNEENDKDGKFIRRERYSGSVSRSFYVGEAVTQEDIRAKYENGILKLTVPKKEAKQIEQSHYIAIEGV